MHNILFHNKMLKEKEKRNVLLKGAATATREVQHAKHNISIFFKKMGMIKKHTKALRKMLEEIIIISAFKFQPSELSSFYL